MDFSALMASMGQQGGGAGFGLGQPLVTGAMGQAGMAAPQGFGAQLQDILAQLGGQMNPETMQKLAPMIAMMQQQQQQQQQQGQPQQQGMVPMAGGYGGMMGGLQGATAASRGYLAQGGGMARNLVNGRGY